MSMARTSALVAVLALTLATSVHGQFGSLLDDLFGRNGNKPVVRPRRNGPYIQPVQLTKLCGPVLFAHPAARPAILRCLSRPNGVEAASEGIAFAIDGVATADADAKAIGLNPRFYQLSADAQAVAKACATAIRGTAVADSLSRAAGYNAKATSESIARAFKGIALSTSTAQTVSLYKGVAISSARAEAIFGAAIATSTAECASIKGGCQAVSRAVANAIGGPAVAASTANCKAGRGGCVASSSASASSVGGNALVSSKSVATSGRKLLAAA